MEEIDKKEKLVQGAKSQEVKKNKIAIGYTVKSLTSIIKRLDEAKLLKIEEELTLTALAETIAVRYVLGKTV